MRKFLHFGLSMPMYRTDSGALRSWEIENINAFLRQRGLLVAECFDSYVVMSHPFLIEEVKETLLNTGLQPILIGATLASLRQVTRLTLAETRVLEVLSPGSLIIVRDNELDSDILPVTIPDSFDLRDICCIFNGAIQVFIWKSESDLTQLKEVLTNLDLEQCSIKQLGILESPMYEEAVCNSRATIVRIFGPGDVKCIVEGKFDYEIVKEASNNISQMEIGEWT